MAVTGKEKATFQALVTVYRKYHLEGYLQGDTTQEALGQDAAKIWDAAHVNFPDLAYAFGSAVIALLSTLLTQTCRNGEYERPGGSSSSAAKNGTAHHDAVPDCLLAAQQRDSTESYVKRSSTTRSCGRCVVEMVNRKHKAPTSQIVSCGLQHSWLAWVLSWLSIYRARGEWVQMRSPPPVAL